VNEALELIREGTDGEDANIIFGTVVDPRLAGAVRITVLATGFSASAPRKRVEPLFRAEPVAPSAPSVPRTSEPEGEKEKEPVRVPTPGDAIDIPAFLRRRS
jgi:cell division protein FtsZ